MKHTRRSFVKTCSAGLAGLFGIARRAEAGPGDVYPGWKPGELDLHFIYTGCGENMFYRLPDGTSILNDTGDFYRPCHLANVPLLPSPDRLGGEWVSRYVQRVYPEKTIDYLIFSHWHSDHVGHAHFCGKTNTDKKAFRFKTLADGTRVNGFLCVAQDFGFRRYFDHQYPARGMYGTNDTSLKLLQSWMERQGGKGPVCEPFRVGARNQIALLRDPGRYADFSVRNICANGRLWDGKDGEHDYAAEYAAKTGRNSIPQNTLSLGFVMQYGKFRFWSGGDTQNIPPAGTEEGLAYEDFVGRRVGPVTLCKANHHGCENAMSTAFVQSVRAQTYVSCVWCPGQVNETTLSRMASPEFHPGFEPTILPTLVPKCRAESYKGRGFMKNVATEGPSHIVVKVLPGGTDYRIYRLEARDESMRILARLDRRVKGAGRAFCTALLSRA